MISFAFSEKLVNAFSFMFSLIDLLIPSRSSLVSSSVPLDSNCRKVVSSIIFLETFSLDIMKDVLPCLRRVLIIFNWLSEMQPELDKDDRFSLFIHKRKEKE